MRRRLQMASRQPRWPMAPCTAHYQALLPGHLGACPRGGAGLVLAPQASLPGPPLPQALYEHTRHFCRKELPILQAVRQSIAIAPAGSTGQPAACLKGAPSVTLNRAVPTMLHALNRAVPTMLHALNRAVPTMLHGLNRAVPTMACITFQSEGCVCCLPSTNCTDSY